MNVKVFYNEKPLEGINRFLKEFQAPLINAQEEDIYSEPYKDSVLVSLNSTSEVPVGH